MVAPANVDCYYLDDYAFYSRKAVNVCVICVSY